MIVNGHDFTQEDLKKSMTLYAVTDRHWLKDGETLTEKVEEAIQGGATFVQLREKTLDEDGIREEAKSLKALCARYDVPFVLDDDVELAKELDLDGVHVGQKDMEAGQVREMLGPDKILGVSAQTVEEAVLAEKRGADYLGVGAVFHTSTKKDADDVSHDTLQAIAEAVSIPVIAIGGIDAGNVLELSGRKIDGVAVITGIFGQPDVKKGTEELKAKTLEMLKK